MKVLLCVAVCVCLAAGCRSTDAWRGDARHAPTILHALEYYRLMEVRVGISDQDSLYTLFWNDPRTPAIETPDAKITFNRFTGKLETAVALDPDEGKYLSNALRPYLLEQMKANVQISDTGSTQYFVIYLDDPTTRTPSDIGLFYEQEQGELVGACYFDADGQLYGYLPIVHLIHKSKD